MNKQERHGTGTYRGGKRSVVEKDGEGMGNTSAGAQGRTTTTSEINFGGGSSRRLDETEWQVSRRLPPRFRTAKNDVYITKKTKIAAQFSKCKVLLDTKCDTVVIHALGQAMGRALNLALMLEEAMSHSVKLDMVTSSVQVTDDVVSLLDADQEESRQRSVSAVHILVSRI